MILQKTYELVISLPFIDEKPEGESGKAVEIE